MFDIGFTEILLIAGIALFVVGPERLPEAVKTISLWIGRFKRGLRETRREIEQQIGADEIRRELHNEEIMQNLEKMRNNVNDVLNEDLMSETDTENYGKDNNTNSIEHKTQITETDADKDFYPEGHEDHDPNDDTAEKLLDAKHSAIHSDTKNSSNNHEHGDGDELKTEFSENSIHPNPPKHSTKP